MIVSLYRDVVHQIVYPASIPPNNISLNFKFDESCHHYSSNKTDLITMKFCTYQDSCAVLVCAKFHCYPTDIRENMNQFYMNGICNLMKILFVWWVVRTVGT